MFNGMVQDLNIFVLLWYMIRYWGYSSGIIKLQQNRKCKNFRVSLLFSTLWIIEDKDTIKSVLDKTLDAKLTFPNKNFFASHPHNLGIGNVDYEKNECLWKGLHNSLSSAISSSMNNDRLENIMDKHESILLGKYGNEYELVVVLDEYINAVWSEFCFGDQKDLQKKYNKTKSAYSALIQNIFYNNTLSYFPLIGWLSCKIRYILNKEQYNKESIILAEYIKNAKEKSLFNEFAIKFMEYNNEHHVIDHKLVNKVIIDNAFLSIFVADFIHTACSESLLRIAYSYGNKMEWKFAKTTGLKQGYLFPWRMRKIPNTMGIFSEGDYALLNIHGAQLFFSYGPRSCIGPRFYNKFYEHLLEILNPFDLKEQDSKIIVRSSDINRPFIQSNHIVKLTLPRDYLQQNLKWSTHKNIKFYHVHEITSNPILYAYIINEFIDIISKYVNESGQTIDGIISAEARGWLFASPIANKLNLPLHVVRKQGKLPGEVVQKTYKKEGYDDIEIMEMPKDITNKNLIIIDDGIASGVTTQALYDLILEGENKVNLICCVISHTYTECLFNSNDIKVVTLFDL